MAKEVIMPRFGMTQEDATIVRWIVKEGQRVEYGDPLCEVTTDKVNMEVEAPADGILTGIRYFEGETVSVTEIIAYLVAEGESLPQDVLEKVKVSAEPSGDKAVLTDLPPTDGVSDDGEEVNATPVARRMATQEGVALTAISGSGPDGRITRQDVERYLDNQGGQAPTRSWGEKVRASPAARRIAQQLGVDLGQVSGSGPSGRVQGWDVQAAVPKSTPRGAQPVAIKLEGIRRTIAQRMQASWQTIPHIMFTLDIDMSRAIAMRDGLNARFGDERPPISMTAVLVKACAAALRHHPQLNSYFREDETLVMPDVNVGVAVAIEEGLIVPVVRQADLKSLDQIGRDVDDLTLRARESNLRPEDVVDGTFTISNLGMFGVDQFTAIINPPQVAILATARMAKRFVPDEVGRPVLCPMMTVTLSVDHRAVDGVGAAQFLSTLRDILETAGAQWG
jgi:pyruvate dehydrogenase E2 component (dihydrolipoamide acetyltransferase)